MEHATFIVKPHTHINTLALKQKPLPFGLSPLLSRLHVYHLARVLLKYRADVVSVSPADVDGDVGEWQEPGSRLRLWQLRIDLQPWLSLEGRVWSLRKQWLCLDKYSYNKYVKAQRISSGFPVLDKESIEEEGRDVSARPNLM